MHLKLLLAAQNKFVIATFIGDEEMFEQAKEQHAIATGKKVNNDHYLRARFNSLPYQRGSAGTSD